MAWSRLLWVGGVAELQWHLSATAVLLVFGSQKITSRYSVADGRWVLFRRRCLRLLWGEGRSYCWHE